MSEYQRLRDELSRRTRSGPLKCSKCGATEGTFMKRPNQAGVLVTVCDQCLSDRTRRDLSGTIDNDSSLKVMGEQFGKMLSGDNE